MIKRAISIMLRKLGFQLIRIQKPKKNSIPTTSRDILGKFAAQFSQDPLNPDLHFQLASIAREDECYFLANSELKTAKFLGLKEETAGDLEREILANKPDFQGMGHNQYYRLWSLANTIQTLSGGKHLSILDVGGGEGALAYFLPECSYCLAEPTVNGISGESLPFNDGAFDYVVACHVLEHIPVESRQQFLAQLLSKSREGLILLNPFQIDGTSEKERLKLMIDITGAEWAKEHLDCTLPNIALIKSFAEQQSLDFEIKPNGSLAASMALVFMDYFSTRAGQGESLEKVNHFFNTSFMGLMDSESFPAAYLVILKKSKPDDT